MRESYPWDLTPRTTPVAKCSNSNSSNKCTITKLASAGLQEEAAREESNPEVTIPRIQSREQRERQECSSSSSNNNNNGKKKATRANARAVEEKEGR